MSFNETFDSDLGAYHTQTIPTDNVNWVGTDGNPDLGCAYGFYPDGQTLANDVDTILVGADTKVSFNFKVVGGIDAYNPEDTIITIGVDYQDAFSHGTFITKAEITQGFWQQAVHLTALGHGFINFIGIQTGAEMYVDTITVGDDLAPINPDEPIVTGYGILNWGTNELTNSKVISIE